MWSTGRGAVEMRRSVLAAALLLTPPGLSSHARGLEQGGAEASRGPDQKESERESDEARVREERAGLELAIKFSTTGPPSELIGILESPATAEELGLSKGQRERIKASDQETRDALKRSLEEGLKALDLKGEARDRALAMGEQRRREVIAESEEKILGGVLTKRQAARAKQLYWRQTGVRGLLEPEVADRLNLSKWQRKELARRYRALLAYEQDPPREISDLAAFLHEPNNEAGQLAYRLIESRHQGVIDELWLVLSPRQLTMWERLLGPPPRSRPGQ